MGDTVEELRREIEVLKEDHKALEEEVRRLRRALAGLRATDRPSGYPESEGSYSYVGSLGGGGGSVAPSSPARSFGSAEGRSAVSSVAPSAATGGVGPISWSAREEIADNIGLWIRRCLNGENRGTSGRDRNPLQSRYWIVVKSIEGEIYNPPLIYKTWSGAKGLVKRGAETGDSIFVGIPSEREAIRVVRFAGLEWPGTYLQ